MNTDDTVVVTRHAGLVEYLFERGLVDKDTWVVNHADIEDVRGKDVIGILPLRLAVEASSVTEIPMDIPEHLRGKELGIDQVRQLAGPARRFVVREVPPMTAREGRHSER